MSALLDQVMERLHEMNSDAEFEGKKTGFIIGNTAKQLNLQTYLIPKRVTPLMLTCGAIVYSECDAIALAKAVDGKVDVVLVDAEKKIADADSSTGAPGNIERAVRENINHSKLWTFKGNDISVDAADAFLVRLYENNLAGIGGKKVSIIGCGNLGSKLALKLVERGAHVFITRRRHQLLDQIVAALNVIKPIHTTSKVRGCYDNLEACLNADIVIGASQGHVVITEDMVDCLPDDAVLLDIGKGTIEKAAIAKAIRRGIRVYRLDVSCAMAGVISKLLMLDILYGDSMGRREIDGKFYVSGGVMGHHGDIVVDSFENPTIVYGIADGVGDFLSGD